MMKTLQNISKIATALTVVAVLVLANSAHAVFTETFDGGAFSASGNVVGNNGWTTGGFRGGSVTPRPSSLTVNTPATAPSLSSGMVAVQNTGGDPGDAFGRDISADIDGDQITVTFDIGGSGVTRFSFGAFGNITNSTGPNHYLYFTFDNGSKNADLTVANADDNRVGEGTVSYTAGANDEFQGRILVNKSTGLTELASRALSTDPWTDIYSFNPVTDAAGMPGSSTSSNITWYNTIDAMSINQQNGPWIDNITIGEAVIPEPATFSLLSLGALMMMLRRRRSA